MLHMRLSEFVEWLDRERPLVLEASLVASVRPVPWVLRAGHGGDARIRMVVGEQRHRYVREQGETVWRRVEGVASADFDVLRAS